jgi:hypothetical protein
MWAEKFFDAVEMVSMAELAMGRVSEKGKKAVTT